MQLFNCFFLVLLGTVHSIKVPLNEQWEDFKKTYNKQYESQSDEALRIQIFEQNLKKIETHNQLYEQGHVTYTMAINHFADLTAEEFSNYNRLKVGKTGPHSSEYLPYKSPENVILPKTVDWRKKGAVTNVKNQGFCGSCWSFSATGALEAQYFLKTGKLVSLSEQYLMDCSVKYDNHGCEGGWPNRTFEFVRDDGIYSENDYPYLAMDDDCKNVDEPKVLKVSNFYEIKSGSEVELQKAVVLDGPISVCVNTSNWDFYHEGIFYDESCSSSYLDHAVLVVGYGTDTDDYWLIKNSWGTTWGIEGYMKLRRNKSNNCGIASSAYYPSVVKI